MRIRRASDVALVVAFALGVPIAAAQTDAPVAVEVLTVGASTREVDEQLAGPLCARLATIPGVTSVDSRATASGCRLRLAVERGRHDEVAERARDLVLELNATSELKTWSDPHSIASVDRDGAPVAWVVVCAPATVTRVEAAAGAERVRAALVRLAGVAGVTSHGGAREVVVVRLDPARLAARELEPGRVLDVLRAVGSSNVQLPRDEREYADAVLAPRPELLLVRDVATVERRSVPEGAAWHAGRRAVVLGVHAVAGHDGPALERAAAETLGALAGADATVAVARPADGELLIASPAGTSEESMDRIAAAVLAAAAPELVMRAAGESDLSVRLARAADPARSLALLRAIPGVIVLAASDGPVPTLTLRGPERPTVAEWAERTVAALAAAGVPALIEGREAPSVAWEIDRERAAARRAPLHRLREALALRAPLDGRSAPIPVGRGLAGGVNVVAEADAGTLRVRNAEGELVDVAELARPRVEAWPAVALRRHGISCVLLRVGNGGPRAEIAREGLAVARRIAGELALAAEYVAESE